MSPPTRARLRARSYAGRPADTCGNEKEVALHSSLSPYAPQVALVDVQHRQDSLKVVGAYLDARHSPITKDVIGAIRVELTRDQFVEERRLFGGAVHLRDALGKLGSTSERT